MPIPAYMTIEGETQGEISAGGCSEESIGTLSKENQEDTIQIQEFRHSISIPTDPQSGQPVAPRVHQEMVITKMQDQTSPLLHQALSTGEKITQAEIKWFRISPAGEEEHYFTTAIENALITKIRSYMPDVIPQDKPGAAASTARTNMEEITIRYNKITWTHEICGTEGEDDWNGADA